MYTLDKTLEGQTYLPFTVRAERATDPEGQLGAYTATPGLPLPQHTEGWARAERAYSRTGRPTRSLRMDLHQQGLVSDTQVFLYVP